VVLKRRNWRRPNDLKNIEKDQECLDNLKSDVSKITDAGEELIFLDECLFNQRHVLNKAWMLKGFNVQPEVMWPASKCVAVLAAISSERGLVHYMCRERSIKSSDYCEFLDDLRRKSGERTLHILLDNCKVHRSKASMQQARALGFHLIWNVPYCPQYNAIEYFWAVVKHKFKAKALAILIG